MNTHDILLGRDPPGSASSSTHGLQSADRDISFSSTAPSSSHQQKRYKKKLGHSGSLSAHSPSMLQLSAHNSNDSDEMVPTSYINKDGMVVEQTADGEWTYDPNEPRYCICNQVSYGEMVACDNAEVRYDDFYIYGFKLIIEILLVSSRMVPLSLRWHYDIAKGQMVLSNVSIEKNSKE
jgi:hypothetical protein